MASQGDPLAFAAFLLQEVDKLGRCESPIPSIPIDVSLRVVLLGPPCLRGVPSLDSIPKVLFPHLSGNCPMHSCPCCVGDGHESGARGSPLVLPKGISQVGYALGHWHLARVEGEDLGEKGVFGHRLKSLHVVRKEEVCQEGSRFFQTRTGDGPLEVPFGVPWGRDYQVAAPPNPGSPVRQTPRVGSGVQRGGPKGVVCTKGFNTQRGSALLRPGGVDLEKGTH